VEQGLLLAVLGVLFLAGLAADQLGRATRLPRVTTLLLLGMVVGEAGFDLLPDAVAGLFEIISIVALTMVAFLLGGTLTRPSLAAHGRAILYLSLAIATVTMAVVAAGLMAVGMAPGPALVLGAIATATAPAAVTDVIDQSGATGGFADTLRGVVAVDDVWGLMLFSVALAAATDGDGWGAMAHTLGRDLGGAVLLGLAVGLPAAVLTGRLSPGEPQQAEAIGIVLLTAGLSLWLGVSFLVAGMVAGAAIGNLARHHDRAFHEIRHVRWPFLLLFFFLAGAVLEPEALFAVGWTGVLFIVLRIAARLAGGWIGARLGDAPRHEAPWYGPALLPQAGVAVGMALVAGEALPDLAGPIMALTVASTVAFELIGPPVTMLALRRVARAESGG
jgi:Kef-type K+ transport system membrane component KefB